MLILTQHTWRFRHKLISIWIIIHSYIYLHILLVYYTCAEKFPTPPSVSAKKHKKTSQINLIMMDLCYGGGTNCLTPSSWVQVAKLWARQAPRVQPNQFHHILQLCASCGHEHEVGAPVVWARSVTFMLQPIHDHVFSMEFITPYLTMAVSKILENCLWICSTWSAS